MKPTSTRVAVLALTALGLGCSSCRRSEPEPPTAPPQSSAVVQTDMASPQPAPRRGRGRAAPATDPNVTAWRFDRVETTPLPPGFVVKGGTWVLGLESKRGRNRVLTQQAKSDRSAFNLVLIEGPAAAVQHLDLRVRLRALAGKIDQGGGLIWRARDAKNYYIARYNPLEDNLRLDSVVQGRHRLLKGVALKVNHAAWHTLRVTMQGDQIRVYLDRHERLSVQDGTFGAAGQIGLWTKADAVTQFDDLELKQAQP